MDEIVTGCWREPPEHFTLAARSQAAHAFRADRRSALATDDLLFFIIPVPGKVRGLPRRDSKTSRPEADSIALARGPALCDKPIKDPQTRAAITIPSRAH